MTFWIPITILVIVALCLAAPFVFYEPWDEGRGW